MWDSHENFLNNNSIENNVYGIVYGFIFDKMNNRSINNVFYGNAIDQPAREYIA